MNLRIKRRTAVKYFTAVVVGALVYCQWGVYQLQSLYWQKLKCRTEKCTKVMFIADPQIQGDLAANPPLNHILNWDSDQFIKSSFNVALNYFKPDILVFLGDLMDEGSISTSEQYQQYVNRLYKIFVTPVNYPVLYIWLPGDNDIGGEFEPIRRDKITLFKQNFKGDDVIHYNNVSFYKINGMTHSYPKRENHDEFIRIAVSHYGITIRSFFGQQVHKEILPDIYFSAHDHQSKYVRQNKELRNRSRHSFTPNDEELIVEFGDEIYEIYVPTCSYRMGTKVIGYGAAVLEYGASKIDRLKYNVFWSPQRFPYLYFYLFIVIITTVYAIIYFISKTRSFRKRTGDKPLLIDMDKSSYYISKLED